MWIEEADEFFKGYIPYYVLIFLPIFIIISPANPVCASHEFPVYRMQHYDIHGFARGSRSASINLEARSLNGWSTSRHCVVVRVQDLTVDHYRNIRTKAGGLLVILPEDLSTLSDEDKEQLLVLENAMLAQEVSIPVYFTHWTPKIDTILTELSSNIAADDKSKSAAEAMLGSIAANGYQIVLNPKTPGAKQDMKVATIYGSLAGRSLEGKTSTITIATYYDSFGVAPELSFGADSNGSGVAMMMELIRLFSTLYSDPKMHGRFNLVFLLTGAGKINFQGSKRWLEDQMEGEGPLVQVKDSAYVMCLDTMATNDALYMHVSKPPKEFAPAAIFFNGLKESSEQYSTMTVDGVHKKINLGDNILHWEHERYSIKRLPAFTLSSLKSHKESSRSTILDIRQKVDVDKLVRNTKVVAEALASQIYNVSVGEVFGGSLEVNRESLEFWMDYLGSQPRSAQLLSTKDNALVNFLKDTFNKYLRDIRVVYTTPDKREPDFMFYDVTKGTMNVYSVKPAVFDLVLTFAIVLYLGSVYLVIQKFPALYANVCNLTGIKKKVH